MAFFQDNVGKQVPEEQNIVGFTEARDDGVAVASTGPRLSDLHLFPDR